MKKDRQNHLYIYGTDIPKIIELQKTEEPELKEKHQITHYGRSGGQFVMKWQEQSMMLRRVRLLFLDARSHCFL
jgi:glycerol-3-phosphate dehydrogenase